MSSTQKTIKYCAMTFAILLAVGIISAMANIAFTIANGFSGTSDGLRFTDSKNERNFSADYDKSFKGVSSLNVENALGNLKICVGEDFRVVANHVSKKFSADVSGDGTLTIKDKGNDFNFLWFNFNGLTNPRSDIIVYVPSNFISKESIISTGAGNTIIEGLKSDYLFIEAGAGKIRTKDLTAARARVDGGVGSITLNQVRFEESDFDSGVGKLDVSGQLLGKTNVDCGVGEVELDLSGEVDDYGYNVDTGLGPIKLNGNKISGKYNLDAQNQIKVDGGVGSVNIKIK